MMSEGEKGMVGWEREGWIERFEGRAGARCTTHSQIVHVHVHVYVLSTNHPNDTGQNVLKWCTSWL